MKNKFGQFLVIPFIIWFWKKCSIDNIKYHQTGKKRWAKSIFDYFRKDNEMIEKFDGKKFLYTKKKKKKATNRYLVLIVIQILI